MTTPDQKLLADIEAIQSIPIISSILDVICQTTGMGLAAVARVTEERWIACSVLDKISFGLQPGGELKVETTLCHEIRQSKEAIIIDHVEKDETYCHHHTPAMYGFQSYISIPIFLKNGSFFGTLCAIDPKPAQLKKPETIAMFNLFAELISFHLNAQEQLTVTEAKLLQERKNAELRDQFIAILGHDLRNPVGAISGGAELLLRMPLDNTAMRIATTIKNSSYRVSGLIKNMLDFASGRLGGGIVLDRKITYLDKELRQVITELLTIWQGRSVIVEFDMTEPVYCDENRIAQLFSNLLSNAITHGAADKPVIVKAISGDGFFELSVINSGSKIPDAAMDWLFQPFTRATIKPGQQGLGLGLYISSEIAIAHGGKLQAVSTEEKTSFILQMPSNPPD